MDADSRADLERLRERLDYANRATYERMLLDRTIEVPVDDDAKGGK